jgi:hypothetical protein
LLASVIVSAIIAFVIVGVTAALIAFDAEHLIATAKEEPTPWIYVWAFAGAAATSAMLGALAILAAERLRAWLLSFAPDASGPRRPDAGGRGSGPAAP